MLFWCALQNIVLCFFAAGVHGDKAVGADGTRWHLAGAGCYAAVAGCAATTMMQWVQTAHEPVT